MRIANHNPDDKKDKIEIVKQQVKEITKVLDARIIPHENHTVFEVDLKKRTIVKAEYKPPKTVVTWTEACEMHQKKKLKQVDIFNPEPISKSDIIKKENCIYISALNVANVKKVLERDFNIKL